jgi:hypothetical protein
MPETPAPAPNPEPDADDASLGLTLSELLGEVWAPVGRRQTEAERSTAAAATDLDSGDPAPWNL